MVSSLLPLFLVTFSTFSCDLISNIRVKFKYLLHKPISRASICITVANNRVSSRISEGWNLLPEHDYVSRTLSPWLCHVSKLVI